MQLIFKMLADERLPSMQRVKQMHGGARVLHLMLGQNFLLVDLQTLLV